MPSRFNRRRSNLQAMGRLSMSCPVVDSPSQLSSNEDSDQDSMESSDFEDSAVTGVQRQWAWQSVRHDRQKNLAHQRNMEQNKISMDDYFSKQAEFRRWLMEEQKKQYTDLSSPKRRTYFKMFIRLWNKRSLPEKYFECRISKHIEEESSSSEVDGPQHILQLRPQDLNLFPRSPALDPTIFPHCVDLSDDSFSIGPSSPFSTFGKSAVTSLKFKPSFAHSLMLEGEGFSDADMKEGSYKSKDSSSGSDKENNADFLYHVAASGNQPRTAAISPGHRLLTNSSYRTRNQQGATKKKPQLTPVNSPKCPAHPDLFGKTACTQRSRQSFKSAHLTTGFQPSVPSSQETVDLGQSGELSLTSSEKNPQTQRLGHQVLPAHKMTRSRRQPHTQSPAVLHPQHTSATVWSVSKCGHQIQPQQVVARHQSESGSDLAMGREDHKIRHYEALPGSSPHQDPKKRDEGQYQEVKDSLSTPYSSPVYHEPFLASNGSDESSWICLETKEMNGSEKQKVSSRTTRRRSRSLDETSVYSLPLKNGLNNRFCHQQAVSEENLKTSPPPLPPRLYKTDANYQITGTSNPVLYPTTGDHAAAPETPLATRTSTKGRFLRFLWSTKPDHAKKPHSWDVQSEKNCELIDKQENNNWEAFPLVKMEKSPVLGRRNVGARHGAAAGEKSVKENNCSGASDGTGSVKSFSYGENRAGQVFSFSGKAPGDGPSARIHVSAKNMWERDSSLKSAACHASGVTRHQKSSSRRRSKSMEDVSCSSLQTANSSRALNGAFPHSRQKGNEQVWVLPKQQISRDMEKHPRNGDDERVLQRSEALHTSEQALHGNLLESLDGNRRTSQSYWRGSQHRSGPQVLSAFQATEGRGNCLFGDESIVLETELSNTELSLLEKVQKLDSSPKRLGHVNCSSTQKDRKCDGRTEDSVNHLPPDAKLYGSKESDVSEGISQRDQNDIHLHRDQASRKTSHTPALGFLDSPQNRMLQALSHLQFRTSCDEQQPQPCPDVPACLLDGVNYVSEKGINLASVRTALISPANTKRTNTTQPEHNETSLEVLSDTTADISAKHSSCDNPALNRVFMCPTPSLNDVSSFGPMLTEARVSDSVTNPSDPSPSSISRSADPVTSAHLGSDDLCRVQGRLDFKLPVSTRSVDHVVCGDHMQRTDILSHSAGSAVGLSTDPTVHVSKATGEITLCGFSTLVEHDSSRGTHTLCSSNMKVDSLLLTSNSSAAPSDSLLYGTAKLTLTTCHNSSVSPSPIVCSSTTHAYPAHAIAAQTVIPSDPRYLGFSPCPDPRSFDFSMCSEPRSLDFSPYTDTRSAEPDTNAAKPSSNKSRPKTTRADPSGLGTSHQRFTSTGAPSSPLVTHDTPPHSPQFKNSGPDLLLSRLPDPVFTHPRTPEPSLSTGTKLTGCERFNGPTGQLLCSPPLKLTFSSHAACVHPASVNKTEVTTSCRDLEAARTSACEALNQTPENVPECQSTTIDQAVWNSSESVWKIPSRSLTLSYLERSPACHHQRAGLIEIDERPSSVRSFAAVSFCEQNSAMHLLTASRLQEGNSSVQQLPPSSRYEGIVQQLPAAGRHQQGNRRRSRSVGDLTALQTARPAKDGAGVKGKVCQESVPSFSSLKSFWNKLNQTPVKTEKPRHPSSPSYLVRPPSSLSQDVSARASDTPITKTQNTASCGTDQECGQRVAPVRLEKPRHPDLYSSLTTTPSSLSQETSTGVFHRSTADNQQILSRCLYDSDTHSIIQEKPKAPLLVREIFNSDQFSSSSPDHNSLSPGALPSSSVSSVKHKTCSKEGGFFPKETQASIFQSSVSLSLTGFSSSQTTFSGSKFLFSPGKKAVSVSPGVYFPTHQVFPLSDSLTNHEENSACSTSREVFADSEEQKSEKPGLPFSFTNSPVCLKQISFFPPSSSSLVSRFSSCQKTNSSEAACGFSGQLTASTQEDSVLLNSGNNTPTISFGNLLLPSVQNTDSLSRTCDSCQEQEGLSPAQRTRCLDEASNNFCPPPSPKPSSYTEHDLTERNIEILRPITSLQIPLSPEHALRSETTFFAELSSPAKQKASTSERSTDLSSHAQENPISMGHRCESPPKLSSAPSQVLTATSTSLLEPDSLARTSALLGQGPLFLQNEPSVPKSIYKSSSKVSAIPFLRSPCKMNLNIQNDHAAQSGICGSRSKEPCTVSMPSNCKMNLNSRDEQPLTESKSPSSASFSVSLSSSATNIHLQDEQDSICRTPSLSVRTPFCKMNVIPQNKHALSESVCKSPPRSPAYCSLASSSQSPDEIFSFRKMLSPSLQQVPACAGRTAEEGTKGWSISATEGCHAPTGHIVPGCSQNVFTVYEKEQLHKAVPATGDGKQLPINRSSFVTTRRSSTPRIKPLAKQQVPCCTENNGCSPATSKHDAYQNASGRSSDARTAVNHSDGLSNKLKTNEVSVSPGSTPGVPRVATAAGKKIEPSGHFGENRLSLMRKLESSPRPKPAPPPKPQKPFAGTQAGKPSERPCVGQSQAPTKAQAGGSHERKTSDGAVQESGQQGGVLAGKGASNSSNAWYQHADRRSQKVQQVHKGSPAAAARTSGACRQSGTAGPTKRRSSGRTAAASVPAARHSVSKLVASPARGRSSGRLVQLQTSSVREGNGSAAAEAGKGSDVSKPVEVSGMATELVAYSCSPAIKRGDVQRPSSGRHHPVTKASSFNGAPDFSRVTSQGQRRSSSRRRSGTKAPSFSGPSPSKRRSSGADAGRPTSAARRRSGGRQGVVAMLAASLRSELELRAASRRSSGRGSTGGCSKRRSSSLRGVAGSLAGLKALGSSTHASQPCHSPSTPGRSKGRSNPRQSPTFLRIMRRLHSHDVDSDEENGRGPAQPLPCEGQRMGDKGDASSPPLSNVESAAASARDAEGAAPVCLETDIDAVPDDGTVDDDIHGETASTRMVTNV